MQANTLASITRRLNSPELSDAYAATLDLFVASTDTKELTHTKALAISIIDATPGKNRREWRAEYEARCEAEGRVAGGLSDATMSALGNGYKMADRIKVTRDDESVRLMVNVYNNGAAKLIEEWIAWVNETSVTEAERLAALTEYGTGGAQRAKKAKRNEFTPEPEVTEPEPEDSDETEPSVTEAGNGFGGLLEVIKSATSRIESGDFSASEAILLAQAMRDGLVAAEAFVSATTNVTIAA